MENQLSPVEISASADQFGTRRDELTGGFEAVVWTLVGAAGVLVAVDPSFSPARRAAGRSSGERPLQAASS
jgi:hypothetical protein